MASYLCDFTFWDYWNYSLRLESSVFQKKSVLIYAFLFEIIFCTVALN